VPGDVGRGALVRADKRVERHDDADLDVDVAGPGLPGEPLDHRVGHDLPPPTGVALGDQRVGAPAQRGQARHPLLHEQEPGQQAHRVRRRPQRHPPVTARGPPAAHIAGRVGLVR
jgi:hypothetical protein